MTSFPASKKTRVGIQPENLPNEKELALLNSIVPVSRETIGRLAVYRQLLNQWQKKTNLVAPSTLPQFWSRHVADSLQLVPLAGNASKWVDIGSGGGFPGLVIAALSAEKPPCPKIGSVHLVESIQKKCAFLRRVVAQADIQASIHCERIESVTKLIGSADVISARALASLNTLLDMVGPHLTCETRALFHKGRGYKDEIQESRGKWDFDLVVHPSKIDPDSVVLEIANVAAKNN